MTPQGVSSPVSKSAPPVDNLASPHQNQPDQADKKPKKKRNKTPKEKADDQYMKAKKKATDKYKKAKERADEKYKEAIKKAGDGNRETKKNITKAKMSPGEKADDKYDADIKKANAVEKADLAKASAIELATIKMAADIKTAAIERAEKKRADDLVKAKNKQTSVKEKALEKAGNKYNAAIEKAKAIEKEAIQKAANKKEASKKRTANRKTEAIEKAAEKRTPKKNENNRISPVSRIVSAILMLAFVATLKGELALKEFPKPAKHEILTRGVPHNGQKNSLAMAALEAEALEEANKESPEPTKNPQGSGAPEKKASREFEPAQKEISKPAEIQHAESHPRLKKSKPAKVVKGDKAPPKKKAAKKNTSNKFSKHVKNETLTPLIKSQLADVPETVKLIYDRGLSSTLEWVSYQTGMPVEFVLYVIYREARGELLKKTSVNFAQVEKASILWLITQYGPRCLPAIESHDPAAAAALRQIMSNIRMEKDGRPAFKNAKFAHDAVKLMKNPSVGFLLACKRAAVEARNLGASTEDIGILAWWVQNRGAGSAKVKYSNHLLLEQEKVKYVILTEALGKCYNQRKAEIIKVAPRNRAERRAIRYGHEDNELQALYWKNNVKGYRGTSNLPSYSRG